MKIVTVRDAIILNMLKEGFKTGQEIEATLGLQKTVAKKSLSMLKDSGMIEKRKSRGKEFFTITDNGRAAIGKLYRNLSLG
jgi:predicted transcriptional regulator